MVDSETAANSGFRLSMDKIRNFKVRSDDVFLLTYPKSGTTWMKEILPLVFNGGDIEAIKDIPVDIRVPYLEFTISAEDDEMCRGGQKAFQVPDDFNLDEMESPRIINSHLGEKFLPIELEEKNPKIIYVARNPKDVSVSSYYFVQLLLATEYKSRPANPYRNFSEFFPDYLDCKNRFQVVGYAGSKWHEHVLTWWKRRHDKNVLFLKYEDMFQDLESNVRKIAKFLDLQLTDDVVKKISDHCTIGNMKKNKMATKSNYCETTTNVTAEEGSPFVRKGGAGGWKKYFTVAENEILDRHYREWMKDSDLEMTFELL
ncbi:sulfotransferase 1E1-like [Ptychodera flava]|uniref:sulfotransferase 1E1-like n=1 Tax=Ptychodera flava TaxID=63121 RepID=UPI00396A158B